MKLLKKSIFILCLFSLVQPILANSKKDIKRINRSLIIDFFMNYELSTKNGNLSTILDFFPSSDCSNYKEVVVHSNVGGNNGICKFVYGKKGEVLNVSFVVRNRVYNYDFVYKGKLLSYINLTDKKIVEFSYDKKGVVKTITRLKQGMAFEYNFNYSEVEKKYDIKLFVTRDDKKRPSSSKYYAQLDNNHRLESFFIDVYSVKNIKYTDSFDILSSSFADVNEDNNKIGWDYVKIDDKGNWLERKLNKVTFKREIVYN